MEVPVGILRKLWSFLSFLPFFLLLLLLGLLKAALVGPVVVGIIFIGNSAVIIGLWTAHFVWTYYCVAKTKKLGLILKILVLVSLPVPLVLWPIFGIVGSLLGGVGYGFFAPLLATFEAVGENVTEKFYHCFVDGCWSTIKGACIVVQDFIDFCFHSYFSYMDELIEKVLPDEKPTDINCSLEKPLHATQGLEEATRRLDWQRRAILRDAVIGSIIYSFFLGLYSGVIVHQEDSLQMGLAYIVSIVSLFDEYVNDLLYLREGSRLPSQA
nr:putative membrane protein [Quercus suber]